jgi:hypothetical protein
MFWRYSFRHSVPHLLFYTNFGTRQPQVVFRCSGDTVLLLVKTTRIDGNIIGLKWQTSYVAVPCNRLLWTRVSERFSNNAPFGLGVKLHITFPVGSTVLFKKYISWIINISNYRDFHFKQTVFISCTVNAVQKEVFGTLLRIFLYISNKERSIKLLWSFMCYLRVQNRSLDKLTVAINKKLKPVSNRET